MFAVYIPIAMHVIFVAGEHSIRGGLAVALMSSLSRPIQADSLCFHIVLCANKTLVPEEAKYILLLDYLFEKAYNSVDISF